MTTICAHWTRTTPTCAVCVIARATEGIDVADAVRGMPLTARMLAAGVGFPAGYGDDERGAA